MIDHHEPPGSRVRQNAGERCGNGKMIVHHEPLLLVFNPQSSFAIRRKNFSFLRLATQGCG
ncbi:MAG: hypothetical protein ACKV2Q_07040 [Planctomycetaceae bacterium]